MHKDSIKSCDALLVEALGNADVAATLLRTVLVGLATDGGRLSNGFGQPTGFGVGGTKLADARAYLRVAIDRLNEIEARHGQ